MPRGRPRKSIAKKTAEKVRPLIGAVDPVSDYRHDTKRKNIPWSRRRPSDKQGDNDSRFEYRKWQRRVLANMKRSGRFKAL
ncbi:MAG: hypothetical protein HY556_07880 [Euryarchaeota archaeon]|nr:hypothetical protein [Euryarchaeota archaeon]